MYGKGFLGNMTENLQADCVQSRQAGFIQCFLKVNCTINLPDLQAGFHFFMLINCKSERAMPRKSGGQCCICKSAVKKSGKWKMTGDFSETGRIIYDCCNFFCNSTCHNAKKML